MCEDSRLVLERELVTCWATGALNQGRLFRLRFFQHKGTGSSLGNERIPTLVAKDQDDLLCGDILHTGVLHDSNSHNTVHRIDILSKNVHRNHALHEEVLLDSFLHYGTRVIKHRQTGHHIPFKRGRQSGGWITAVRPGGRFTVGW